MIEYIVQFKKIQTLINKDQHFAQVKWFSLT